MLTRNETRARALLGDVETYTWEPDEGPPPDEALRDVDIVFNLMGEPLADRRWTREKKRRIRDSRVRGLG